MRLGIIIAIVALLLITIYFINQNQKKAVVVTVSHTTPTVTLAPTNAGQSATITPQEPTTGPTHIIITTTPEVQKITSEPTTTP
jgi:hypothetical protein